MRQKIAYRDSQADLTGHHWTPPLQNPSCCRKEKVGLHPKGCFGGTPPRPQDPPIYGKKSPTAPTSPHPHHISSRPPSSTFIGCLIGVPLNNNKLGGQTPTLRGVWGGAAPHVNGAVWARVRSPRILLVFLSGTESDR